MPFVTDLIECRRMGGSYADRQKIRAAVYSGDTDTLSVYVDRLREKAARRIEKRRAHT